MDAVQQEQRGRRNNEADQHTWRRLCMECFTLLSLQLTLANVPQCTVLDKQSWAPPFYHGKIHDMHEPAWRIRGHT